MFRFVAALSALLVVGCNAEPESMASNEPRPAAEQPPRTSTESSSRVDPALVEKPSATVGLGGDTTVDRIEAEAHSEEPDADDADETVPTVARDLATELNIAVGSLRDCMQNTGIVRSTLEVSATALILPAGTVAQPSVTGLGLSQAERNCMARRVRTVVLEPLEDQTSQRVTTRILIDFSAPAPVVRGYQVGPQDPVLRNVREPLPKRPEAAPSGRTIQEPTSRPIQEPTSRPIQEPRSRKIRGPQPRPIDGWDVDQSSKDWR